MDETALRAAGVSFSYGSREIIADATIEVAPGQILGLVGCNGSGKTTLLRLLAGFLPAARGEVRIDSELLSAVNRRALAQRLAIVTQDTEGELPFTVAEVVLLGRLPHQSERSVDIERARQALEAVGMVALAQRPFQELSGGERQLVLIARALAQEPRYLLLDEPTNHLDVYHQHALLSLLTQQRDRGVIVVLHDLNLAARYCDTVAVLASGTIRAVGTPTDVLTPELIDEVFSVRAHVTRDGGVPQLLMSHLP